jgi:hypothetical protein
VASFVTPTSQRRTGFRPGTDSQSSQRALAAAAITLGIVLWAPAGAAQSFQRSGGSVSTALAGAGAAAVSDATALWHNPAGLALEAQSSALAGLSLLAERTRYATAGQPSIRDVGAPLFAPRIAARLSLADGALALGLGYRSSSQRALRFAATEIEQKKEASQDCTVVLPRLRYQGRSHESQEHGLTLAVAGRRGALAFGAALELSYTRLGGERALFAGGATDPLDSDCRALDARWALDGVSVGGRAGLAFAPAWWITLGLSLELPRWSSLSGSLGLTPPTFPPSGVTTASTRDGEASMTLLEPLELALALAMHVSKDLRLHAEVGLRLGAGDAALRSRGAALVLEEGTSQERSLAAPELPLHPDRPLRWRWHLGLRWSLLDGLITLRGGWAYLTAGFDGAPSSALFDPARHRLGFGLAVARGRWRAGLALSHDLAATIPLTRTPLPLLPEAQNVSDQPVGGQVSSSRTRVLAEVQLTL